MFGRSKDDQATAPAPVTPEDRLGGKGRPTPRRREAEQRNRRPVVMSAQQSALSKNATKEEKKAYRAARRQAMAEARGRTRQAMMTGDDRHLPARDQGPTRRFVRDYVDSRRNLGEYFLPVALVLLVLTITGIPLLQLLSTVVLYVFVLAVAVDAFLLRRRINREVEARFGGRATSGSATYGMLRSLQMRRTRMPKPQVGRGQRPR